MGGLSVFFKVAEALWLFHCCQSHSVRLTKLSQLSRTATKLVLSDTTISSFKRSIRIKCSEMVNGFNYTMPALKSTDTDKRKYYANLILRATYKLSITLQR